MTEEVESAAPSIDAAVPDSFSEFLVSRRDGSAELDYVIGSFSLPSEGLVPIILITRISNQLLVAVPQGAWNRLRAHRVLPVSCLSKAVLAEVQTARELDREVIEGTLVQKVWIGLLGSEFESCLSFDTFDAEQFVFSFKCESGEEGYVPYAESLVAIADDRFSFMTAESTGAVPSFGEPAGDAHEESALPRIAKLEEALVSVQTSLQQLISQSGTPPPVTRPPALRKPPKQSVQKTVEEDGFAGLDPQVVASALAAGIDRNQLSQFSKLVASHRPKLADTPGKRKSLPGGLNVLCESEDEAEDTAEQKEIDPQDPVASALVKLTAIVDALSHKKKSRVLDEFLEDSGGTGEASSSSSVAGGHRRHAQVLQMLRKTMKTAPEEIYRVLENRMLSDFGAPEAAPGEPLRAGTFRGWTEHRSRIPNLGPSVRAAWAVSGALDSLRLGKTSEAQARLALYLGQLDQVSVDRGQWILAAEGSLEDAPPFSSFSKHVPPDLLEPQHTRLWPSAWAECFMYKVKELDEFVEKRSKLGKRGSQNQGAAAEEGGKKGGGKKGNPKIKPKPQAEEATSTTSN